MTMRNFRHPEGGLARGKYSDSFFDEVHVNYRQMHSLLITQNNAIGSLLGAITATADNLMYWDMPFQVLAPNCFWNVKFRAGHAIHFLATRQRQGDNEIDLERQEKLRKILSSRLFIGVATTSIDIMQ